MDKATVSTTAESLHEINSGPIGFSIATIGLLGNIFSVIIWSRISSRRKRGSGVGDQTPACAMYFSAMAIIDSGLLISFLMSDSLPSLVPSLKRTLVYAQLFSYLIYPLFYFFVFSTIWIVAAVTVHRFLLVIHGKAFTIRKNLLSVLIINIIGFLVQIPQFFAYRPVFIPESNTTDGYWTFTRSDFANTKVFVDYLFWLHCIFIVLVPWFLIAILNILLLHTVLRKTNTVITSLCDRDKVSRMSRNRRMTITLLTVTISFLVLLAWQCVAQCFWQLGYHKDDTDKTTWNIVNASFAFAKLGIVINSSINCLLYYVSGPIFRKEVAKFLGMDKRKKTTDTQTSQTASTEVSGTTSWYTE